MREEEPSRGQKLASLASKQHGVVEYGQLIGLGFSRGAIDRHVRSGYLHRLYKGVYAVGHSNMAVEGRAMAAVLACGPGALLSHWSAAKLWGLLQPRRPLIDVVVPGDRAGPKGVQVRCVKSLHPSDRGRRAGIPVTTVPRTLLDLAAEAHPRQLRRAVNEADRRGWLHPETITEICERHKGKRGMTAFRAVTAAVHPQTRRTRSDLEVDFLKLCRKYKLPQPDVNVEIEGYEVDIHFPGTKLIVELDGYEFHRTRTEFDSDRRRDAHLKVKGYEVLRVSDEWLNSDPRGVAMTIRALL